jgi:mono/diheme cytochrome c family protein
LGASTIQSAGAVIGALAFVGFVVYVAFNILSGRREAGSEIELAPNRKPYLSDEALETTKLNWTLAAGLGLLLVIAVGLPVYWLAEPGRQEGAERGFDETFVSRGQEIFDESSDCAACHGPGGTGGQASYTLLEDDGETYVATVQWMAPALDAASLRFTDEEIAQIIEFGRPGTPMVGWGEGGQGPLTEQQISNLVDYVFSLQGDLTEGSSEAPYEVVQADLAEQLAEDLGVSSEDIDYTDLATGEALFNMRDIGSGAYACARCHTQGWSIQTDNLGDPREPMRPWPDFIDSPPGSGAFGPPLRDLVPSQFGSVDALAEFVDTGTVEGQGYGRRGQGSGRMPSFGSDPNTESEHDGMYTQEMVCAVALYVSTLPEEAAVEADASAVESPFEPGGFCQGILHDEELEEEESDEVTDE